jgi:hypothetical protein
MTDENNKGLIQRVNGWFLHPFNSQGSALTWVLFVGIIVIATGLWNFVIIEIRREV